MKPGGTYALLLHLSQPAHLQVGRLGRFLFPGGYYLYLGSALTGLRARLARHLRQEKRIRWHIDYLLAQAQVVELWWEGGRERLECAWAARAGRAPGAALPVRGFGSSDCRCPSHLLLFSVRPTAATLVSASISKLDLAPPALEPGPSPRVTTGQRVPQRRPRRGQAPALR